MGSAAGWAIIMTDECAKFLCHFPDRSALRVEGDGMVITLVIPESEMPKALPLIALRQKVLEVTIKAADTRVLIEDVSWQP